MRKNYTTQTEKIERISDKTLVIGVDIAKDSHYAQVVNWRKQESEKGLIIKTKKTGMKNFLDGCKKPAQKPECYKIIEK